MTRNFGLSGKNEKIIPLQRFNSELQIKNNRHGLNSISKMYHVQSIGIIRIAADAINMAKPLRNIEANATARGASFAVWNSLT